MISTAPEQDVTPPIERLLRPDEVAAVLGVSKRTVYALVNRGDLRACRIGLGAGTIRVHPADLQDFLAKLRQLTDPLPVEQRVAGDQDEP